MSGAGARDDFAALFSLFANGQASFAATPGLKTDPYYSI
jgi:hypothetical protein